MLSVTVHHYDAFCQEKNKGNPAGIVLNADTLTVDQMQQIAFEVGFNETAFALQSNKADLRIRFFTPGHEMNLCGHATMAMISALLDKDSLNNKTMLNIETAAGVLPIALQSGPEGNGLIQMTQSSPLFTLFKGDKTELAHAIGINKDDICDDLPIVYGSTGTWTLLVPIKSLAAFEVMQPNNKAFPSILTEMPKASVHPFCLETYYTKPDMHARHFSSPYSGTIEDPVTGTASGVMGAYYAKFIVDQTVEPCYQLTIEQGQEIGKDGEVRVCVTGDLNQLQVSILGQAIHNKDLKIDLTE
nr:PhzF family phenazine biosynthesis protein [Amphibacillus sediminis]